MSKLYKGIVVAAGSKAEVVAAFAAVATGKNARVMKSTSGALYATDKIAYDPCGNGTLAHLKDNVHMEFASESATTDANMTVCLDGCQKFILSEATLQRCPSCSAELTASEDDIHDLVFGSESDDLLQRNDPVFCGTEEQVAVFSRALRTGTLPSLSGELATLNFDPFNGDESVRSCSHASEFSGVFHKFKCAATCSHPVTLSASADVVFCAHCNAPLEESEKMTIKQIAKVDQRVHVFAPSLSAALNNMRSLLMNGGKASHFDHKLDGEDFVSNSACAFNPYTGNNVKSNVMDSVSGVMTDQLNADAIDVHLFKCHDGCGFMASSSSDASFCSECNAPLVEPSEEDLVEMPEADVVSTDGDTDDLESELAELDEEDEFENDISMSGDEDDFDDIEGEELELDLDDEDDASLSSDDFDDEDEDDEDEDLPDFNDDEEDDEDEDDDEESFEPSEDFAIQSESGDEGDEDEDTMLTDEELAELDFEEDTDMESESSVISISASEAIEADEFDVKSLSCVFDGQSRWHAIYQNSPVGSLTFTGLSSALGDEAKAKLLFRNGTMPNVLSASARENGLSQALEDYGFEPVTFNVSVSKVLEKRASKSADERVNLLQEDINNSVQVATERLQASVSTAMLGLTRKFWKQDGNAVADAIVNKIVAASGLSQSSVSDLVTSAFAENGADLAASVFARASHLSSMSVDAYNEVSRAIEEINVSSVSSGARDFGVVVKPTTKPAEPDVNIQSQSSTEDRSWDEKMRLLNLR